MEGGRTIFTEEEGGVNHCVEGGVKYGQAQKTVRQRTGSSDFLYEI